MSLDRFIGSATARVGGIVLAAATVWLAMRARTGPPYLLWTAVLTGVLALVCAVHASRAVLGAWMHIAERLHAAVVTTLFSACYLLLVPLFTAMLRRRDPLRRRRPGASSWVRRTADVDARSLERMG